MNRVSLLQMNAVFDIAAATVGIIAARIDLTMADYIVRRHSMIGAGELSGVEESRATVRGNAHRGRKEYAEPRPAVVAALGSEQTFADEPICILDAVCLGQ